MTSKAPKHTTAIALAGLIAIGLLGAVEAEAAEIAPALARQATTEKTSAVIERIMRSIKSAKKPLPAWAIELALRAYEAYKAYRNGQKLDEVQFEVQSVLEAVADIKDHVEAGREFTDREFRLTRELLDAHRRRLDDLTIHLERLEPRVDALQISVINQIARAKAWARFNRVCREPEFVWRPSLGRCVHVSEAGSRR